MFYTFLYIFLYCFGTSRYNLQCSDCQLWKIGERSLISTLSFGIWRGPDVFRLPLPQPARWHWIRTSDLFRVIRALHCLGKTENWRTLPVFVASCCILLHLVTRYLWWALWKAKLHSDPLLVDVEGHWSIAFDGIRWTLPVEASPPRHINKTAAKQKLPSQQQS